MLLDERDDPAWSHLFRLPCDVLVADDTEEVIECLREAERQLESGRAVAGYVAYEAASAFGLPAGRSPAVPLLWLGIYDHWCACPGLLRPPSMGLPDLRDAQLNVDEGEYSDAVSRVRGLIHAGDTYQVNLTCKLRFSVEADPADYYLLLRDSQPVPYGAYLNAGSFQVLSLSPELFLHVKDGVARTKPMKGTAPRGMDVAEDATKAGELRGSEKERAENLMIVDLMRNDLGRVCEYGSVRVPTLFEVERYATLFQMTSTVEGTLDPGVGPLALLQATFPAGSVTGAPKHRTMQIIRELEREPRGVYTGAIGAWFPDGDCILNVAIRTVTHRDGMCEVGIGSGVTWDSSAALEYQETRLKATFLMEQPPAFHLFETMLLDEHGHYRCLRQHLRRLHSSADYWGFPFDTRCLVDELRRSAAHARSLPSVVRLSLDRCGAVWSEGRSPSPTPTLPAVLLSSIRVDSGDRRLRHKTSERDVFDAARREAGAAGCWEALMVNERGRITEGTVTSILYSMDGAWFTPPVAAGLLPGIWRADALRRMGTRERSLHVSELVRCEQIVLGNSVRGPVAVGSVRTPDGQRLWTSAPTATPRAGQPVSPSA